MTPRQQAQATGAIKYDGRPCRCGHTLRYTGSTKCVECQAERDMNRPDRHNEKGPRRLSRTRIKDRKATWWQRFSDAGH